MDIWQACAGVEQIIPLRGRLVRLVENQGQVATLQLVDTLEEQALLEQLLESSKPPLPPGDEPLHYLLRTPFRYPPLRWGSRFGRRHEPSLFYAACRLETAMAETAFYRFVLWYGMVEPPPSGRILSEHSSFEARYQVQRGVRLQLPPFDGHRALLTHRSDYRATHSLGSAMREAGVEAFEYPSARCPQGGQQRCPVCADGVQREAAAQPAALAVRNHRRLRGLQERPGARAAAPVCPRTLSRGWRAAAASLISERARQRARPSVRRLRPGLLRLSRSAESWGSAHHP